MNRDSIREVTVYLDHAIEENHFEITNDLVVSTINDKNGY